MNSDFSKMWVSLLPSMKYPRERGPKNAIRDCTGKPVEDMGDKYRVLSGPLGNTFAKTTVAPVQKNLFVGTGR